MIRSLFLILTIIALWAAPAAAVRFDHADHLEYMDNPPCAKCHLEGAQSIVPDTKVCLECHEEDLTKQFELPSLTTHGPTWPLNHRQLAKSEFKFIDCFACHAQADCMECHKSGFADEQDDFSNDLTNVHRSDFFVTHPIPARTDPRLCSSCHENRFCVECHNDFAPADLATLSHRRGWSNITISGTPHSQFNESQCQTCHPNSVLPAHEWTTQHAREARKNLATCQSCHPQGDVCLQCHSATSGLRVNPHPEGWDDIKGRLERASGGKTCRRCH